MNIKVTIERLKEAKKGCKNKENLNIIKVENKYDLIYYIHSKLGDLDFINSNNFNMLFKSNEFEK